MTAPFRARPARSSSIRANAAARARASTSRRRSSTKSSTASPTSQEDQSRDRASTRSRRWVRSFRRSSCERVCNYLDTGKTEGAQALRGGKRMGDKGYFVEPTVLVNTNEKMKVVQEEIFGPVVTAMPFNNVEEMIAARQRYGLRTRGRRLDARYRKAHQPGRGAARGHGLDQLLQHLRRRSALRRLQAVGLGPRNGPRRAGDVHGNEGGVHQAVNARKG